MKNISGVGWVAIIVLSVFFISFFGMIAVSEYAMYSARGNGAALQAQITTLKAATVSLRAELDTHRAEVRGAVNDCQFRLESVDQMYSLALEKVNDAAKINQIHRDLHPEVKW